MINWEYRIVSIAATASSATEPGGSAAVATLDEAGRQGWEAVGLTAQSNGESAVLMKRAVAQVRTSGGRV